MFDVAKRLGCVRSLAHAAGYWDISQAQQHLGAPFPLLKTVHN